MRDFSPGFRAETDRGRLTCAAPTACIEQFSPCLSSIRIRESELSSDVILRALGGAAAHFCERGARVCDLSTQNEALTRSQTSCALRDVNQCWDTASESVLCERFSHGALLGMATQDTPGFWLLVAQSTQAPCSRAVCPGGVASNMEGDDSHRTGSAAAAGDVAGSSGRAQQAPQPAGKEPRPSGSAEAPADGGRPQRHRAPPQLCVPQGRPPLLCDTPVALRRSRTDTIIPLSRAPQGSSH